MSSSATHFHHSHLLRRTDSQIAETGSVKIGPHALAFAQCTVQETVAGRETHITFHNEFHAFRLEQFDHVAAVMQHFTMLHKKCGLRQLPDKCREVLVFRVDDDFHTGLIFMPAIPSRIRMVFGAEFRQF